MLHINDHTAHRYYSHLSCSSGIKNRYNKNTIVCNLLKMIIISINCPLLDRVSIFNMHLDEQVKTDQAQEPSFSWRLFACLSLKIQYSSPLWTGAEVHDRHGVYRLWPCSVVVGPPSGPSYISLLSPLSSTASKPLGFHCYVVTRGFPGVDLAPVAVMVHTDYCVCCRVSWFDSCIPIHNNDMLCFECAWVGSDCSYV